MTTDPPMGTEQPRVVPEVWGKGKEPWVQPKPMPRWREFFNPLFYQPPYVLPRGFPTKFRLLPEQNFVYKEEEPDPNKPLPPNKKKLLPYIAWEKNYQFAVDYDILATYHQMWKEDDLRGLILRWKQELCPPPYMVAPTCLSWFNHPMLLQKVIVRYRDFFTPEDMHLEEEFSLNVAELASKNGIYDLKVRAMSVFKSYIYYRANDMGWWWWWNEFPDPEDVRVESIFEDVRPQKEKYHEDREDGRETYYSSLVHQDSDALMESANFYDAGIRSVKKKCRFGCYHMRMDRHKRKKFGWNPRRDTDRTPIVFYLCPKYDPIYTWVLPVADCYNYPEFPYEAFAEYLEKHRTKYGEHTAFPWAEWILEKREDEEQD